MNIQHIPQARDLNISMSSAERCSDVLKVFHSQESHSVVSHALEKSYKELHSVMTEIIEIIGFNAEHS